MRTTAEASGKTKDEATANDGAMKEEEQTMRSIFRGKRLGALACAAMACGLVACQSTNPAEGIAYREARFEKMQAQQNYEKCVDEALTLDQQARETRSPAQYLASARLLERCEQDLGPHADEGMEQARMRAYALSSQNHFKGGDVARAGENLERFREAFPGRDLIYPDGSSFRDTMAVLVGQVDFESASQLTRYNIPSELKSELMRARYWKRH